MVRALSLNLVRYNVFNTVATLSFMLLLMMLMMMIYASGIEDKEIRNRESMWIRSTLRLGQASLLATGTCHSDLFCILNTTYFIGMLYVQRMMMRGGLFFKSILWQSPKWSGGAQLV